MTFLQRYIEVGDLFVDAGANIGTYTLLAASLVGPSGSVIAFEPAPLAFSRLAENVTYNKLEQVSVHQAAVGDLPGELPMRITADVSNSLINLRDAETVLVTVLTIDSALKGRSPAVIKLDVEGFEPKALCGMEKALMAERAPVVLLELVPHLLNRAGMPVVEVKTWLAVRGYQLYVYDRDLCRLEAVMTKDLAGNFFAVRDDSLADVQNKIRDQEGG